MDIPHRNLRRDNGQSMVVLTMLIAFFVLLIVGLFAFELNRAEVARQQLRSACDAAALAGAATLASQDNLDPAAAHTEAMNTALNTFQRNSVAGFSLSTATFGASQNDNPSQDMSTLFIQFLDPNNNNQVVQMGDPAGKVLRCTAAFGLRPAFSTFLRLPKVSIRAVSSGGVPDLDVVLCFDISGSIDDQTPVTFVRRTWNGTAATGNIQYTITTTKSGSPVGSQAKGRIYDVIGPPSTGTRVNGIAPQYLELSDQSDCRWGLTFSEDASASRGLRGTTNNSPPGNYPSTGGNGAGTGTANTYTDLVVNVDGNNTFGGFTSSDGYSFPNIGTLVEASRGNLENPTIFSSSKANKGVPGTVTPRTGYQAKYVELAHAQLHPIADAQAAAAEFFTIMNTNTSGHFGLIAFSDNAGTSNTGTYSAPRVSSSYSAVANGNFPVTNVALSSVAGVTNYDEIIQRLPDTVATTSTNIGDAVNRAVQQLQSNGRPGSKRAIVLFTDGMPTTGGPLNSDPWTNARMAAVAAKNAGIAIYTIGLAQNPEIIPQETAILNDTNANTSSGGMAAIAGNGGKFFLVTNVANLRATFQNIARQLVQLVR